MEAEIRVAVETIFPTWLLLGCLARLGTESPHTRIELIETVLGGRDDALFQSQPSSRYSEQFRKGSWASR